MGIHHIQHSAMDSADLATPVDCKPRIAEKEATYDLETPKTVVAAEIGVFFKEEIRRLRTMSDFRFSHSFNGSASLD